MSKGYEYIELTPYLESPSWVTSTNSNPQRWNFTESQLQLILLRLGVISDEIYGTDFALSQAHLSEETKYMITKINELSISDAIEIVRDALAEHSGDVNFLREDYQLLERLVSMIPANPEAGEPKHESSENFVNVFKNKTYLNVIDWSLQIRLEAALIHFHSPYPEIRAITEPFDDPEIPVETFRVYFIGLFWTFIGSIINVFFVHRMPSISLSSHTIQILLLPSGKLWEKFVPNKTIRIGKYSIDLNPGPWTYKEMMLSTIIYSCSAGTPYSVYNIVVMKLDRFYGLKWVTYTFQFLLAISTQFLGFGFALIMKKVCVYPSKALWPTILPTIALNKALMNEDENNVVHGWSISRYSFFMVVFFFSFVYNWIPTYFFTALSLFNWPTWFNPSSIHLTNVAGSINGLGLNPLPSFDWNILGSAGCLTVPFYTYANRYLGSLMGFVVILIVYYTNNNWTGYLPINSNRLFNNKAEVYDVHKILDEKNLFDDAKYQEVGPPYFSAANLVLYGAYFCLYPFAILYHFMTEWESMKSGFVNVWHSLVEAFKFRKDNSHENIYGRYAEDPHCKMMSKYEDVPDWWFVAILVISTVFALAVVLFYPTETPIWGIFFTILINFVFLIPLTSIASVTGFTFGLNVLVELIVGYAIPNSGIALITLKSFGYNIDSQASNYITDQKLAHYAKIPPKAIFKGQLISTMLNVVVALVVTNWQLANVSDICSPHQKDKLKCPGANTYFFSSIQYGEIGPAKVFSGLYPILKWCFLLGTLLVFPCVWFKNNGPKKLTRYFQPTVIIGGFLDYAPYNLSYLTGGLYLSYIFMYKIKKNYLLWWEKYNYILTSALSAGVAFSALLIFFTVQFHPHHLEWWGNTIGEQGIEGGALPDTWLNVSQAPDGYIGLRKGQFP
ncbi:oligopeptide transporter protein [Spathaspora passalidarum NRRL Y-27907]|uniref:Oligopeptide transporter protein n=1 Tax=Spathaspora passalidarum (strain NRRL Y-27907 / 11-Y1) TaxID=619300 RepID=G3AT33_SPAPN|nr:oligopeptide transporter protein [Spathaspora passalidarum NRRL Y-27907]EGW30796.1 oligopeptide transporter protein [Spathaspora passalidarum NRRL Y-27907]